MTEFMGTTPASYVESIKQENVILRAERNALKKIILDQETEIAALKAEVKRLKEWHLIEDAPKDGTKILAKGAAGYRVIYWYAEYQEAYPWTCINSGNSLGESCFTHFRYIPESEVGNG